MLKIIVSLIITLTISLGFNYGQYHKLKARELLITQQKDSLKDLDKKIKLAETIRGIGNSTFEEVIRSTEVSNIEFNNILSSLPIIDVCKQEKEYVKENINNQSTIIDAYYKQLHAAYDLQASH